MIKIPKEELLELLYGEEVVEDTIIENSRWSILHNLVFRYNGKVYETTYRVGATEQQDESPWEFENDVECFEVAAKQVTRTEYVRV